MKQALHSKDLHITIAKPKQPLISSLLKEIAEFKGWEMIFQTLSLGFICWGIYALFIIYRFHHDPIYADVPKFSIYDFKLAIIPTIVFFFYHKICSRLFIDRIKGTLDPKKFPSDQERVSRATKSSVWLSSTIYYAFTSVLAYALFHDSWFFPTSLGGSAQCSAIYRNILYVPNIPYAVLFYQIQFGWHLHNLLEHIILKWNEPKYWEILLHHGVAVFLIFFSYLSNQVAVGILVLATHDPCDVGLYSSRLYNDVKSKKFVVLALLYFGFFFSWIYFRLWVFPTCVVGQAFIALWSYPVDMMYPVYTYMIFMMSALVILHLYWFVFIVRIAVGLFESSKDYNLYDVSKKKSG